MTPVQRLIVIEQAARRLQAATGRGERPDRLEVFQFAETVAMVASESDHFLQLNRAQIEETLGVELPTTSPTDT